MSSCFRKFGPFNLRNLHFIGSTLELEEGHEPVTGSVASAPKVADALLDVYVGPNAVSPAARDSICAGLKAF